jgi:hypothetical protein
MRNLPIAFVICANPEPIGLAIKHKYGLTTVSGDYEARRILEKFVDVYVDMSEPLMLDEFVYWLWKNAGKNMGDYAFIARLDESYVKAITTSIHHEMQPLSRLWKPTIRFMGICDCSGRRSIGSARAISRTAISSGAHGT